MPSSAIRSMQRPRSSGLLASLIREFEKKTLMEALDKFDGHCTKTAAYLGIAREGLYGKIRAYGLDGEAVAMRVEAGIMGPRGPLPRSDRRASKAPGQPHKRGRAR